MKRNKKIFAAAAVALIAALSGCGKKETQETKTEGYVYVPQYVQMDMGSDYIYAAVSTEDAVIVCAQNWDETSEKSMNYLYKYNISEDTTEKLAMDTEDNSNISSMAMGPDGRMFMAINNSSYETDENGEVTDASQAIELWEVSTEDGSVKSVNDVTEFMGSSSDYMYIQAFCIDGQGNFYLYDGEKGIHILSGDYKKVCDIAVDTWINSMTVSKEGDVYISTYGDNGMETRKVDLAAKAVGAPVEGIANGYGNQSLYTGAVKSLLVTASDQVSRMDIATGEKEDLFKWMDLDVNSDSIRYAGELSDGRIWAMLNDYRASGDSSNELVFAVQKDASEVVAKEEIVFGTLWVDYNIKRSIIDFNKKSEKYHISVKEYGGDDYEAGMTQFNADLTTANCPDIISLSTIDYNQYANKGVLEDLYPYMEKSGLNKSDFVENVMSSFEVGGKLYGIMPQFYISTTMAKASLVGDKSGWNLSEMLDFVESVDAENVFSYGTRSSIFYYCIYNNIDEFINWETGECFFDTEDFIRVLEFAARFPEEVDYNNEEEGISSKLRNDRLLLMQSSISSVQEYQMMVGMFGEPIAFVGYPNNERKGNLIQAAGGSLGLSAKSEKKEGAWEFMQSLLTEEFQNGLVSEHGNYGFPVRKSALDAQFELDMTPDYYEDENGEQVESPKTHWGWDDFEMEIMAATQEEIDAVKALIASAEKISIMDGATSQPVKIITEESEAFFKGQKSAADVAGVIQNRIQIYVNENR